MNIQTKKHKFVITKHNTPISIYWNFVFLPKSFIAITLFGRIFSNFKKEPLERYLYSPRGLLTVNHEYIHILQALSFKTKWIGFYFFYLYYWIKNLFKFGVTDLVAYYNIPFEIEAYLNSINMNYKKSNWKKYIRKGS